MKLTVNGVEYERVERTPFRWQDADKAFPGVQLCHALTAISDARHQAAEILQSTTEDMRHARTERNRWQRLAADAREVLRRIDDADAADSQDLRAIRSWCASFDAESVDL